MTTFRGTSGDDHLTGSAGDDNFLLWRGGNDTADGGAGNDIFRMGGALNAADKLDGGAGKDYLNLDGDYSAGLVFNADTITNIEVMGMIGGHSYNLTLNDGNVATGERLLVKAERLGSGDHLTFNGSAETDGNYYIIAGAGDDTLTGGAKHDVFDLSGGGTDTAHGGGGMDTFVLGGALTAADTIDGGAGSDTLVLNGDYSGGLTFGATTMTGVETLQLLSSDHYVLNLNDANVAAAQTLTVDFSTATGIVEFSGANETDGSFHFVAGAVSAMSLFGGAGNDVFDLTGAGSANVVNLVGNGGNDTYLFGADFNNLSFSPPANGGAGNDTAEFNGDYASLLLHFSNVVNIETFRFDAGHSYGNVTIAEEGSFAATIDASQVATLFHLSYADLPFTIEVGSGGMDAASIDPTALNDTFIVTSEASLAASALDAGPGSDTLELNGDFSSLFTFGATTATNFEAIKLDDGHNYDLKTNDATVASGATFTVDASSLTTNTLTFHGSAELDGKFHIIGGGGDDAIIGGRGADTLTGGGGADTFIYSSGLQSNTAALDSITDFVAGTDMFHLGFAVDFIGEFNSGDATGTLDGDIAAALGEQVTSIGFGFVFDFTGADFTGRSFLVVDSNGDGNYNPGADLVVELTGHTGFVSSSDFV
jgi:hypothetical protein